MNFFPFRNKRDILPAQEQEQIVAAIRAAEALTTGEIRVFIEHRCAWMDAMDRAREIFAQLDMIHTAHRNATLIYVALTDQQFAIFGDEEIYSKAGGPQFWEAAAATLRHHLRKGEAAGAIAQCVTTLGTALAAHFPAEPGVKKNELPDEIVFGK